MISTKQVIINDLGVRVNGIASVCMLKIAAASANG
jgi:hypothetical protein